MTAAKDVLDAMVKGQTVVSRFMETLDKHAGRVALRARDDDGESWHEWTYRDWADRTAAAAAHLQSLGVEPGDRVVLMMRNVPDFHFLDLAVKVCGATPVSIYNSSSPEQVRYLTEHCRARVALCGDGDFAERFRKVRSELPSVEHLLDLSEDGTADALYGGSPVELAAEMGNCTPETLATIIYTSGTTGPPKGVMLDHYNITWTAQAYLEMLDIDPVGYRIVSYLPMAHIAERMSSHYLAMMGGYEVSTCPDPGSIAEYLVAVRPNIAFGVPRVWEKIYAGLTTAIDADPERSEQFGEALEASKALLPARSRGEMDDEQTRTWEFLQEVAFRPILERVGLDQCEYAVSGAAPIPPEMLEWFRAIGLPLSEIYGMSESSGPITWEPHQVVPGSVGRAFHGCEVKLAEDGEICCRGGNVFRGYLDEPEKTAETLDGDGWLHSGDIGEVDERGYYRVIDRKKELIITAGGKNVSPANLEASLKMVPLIGQACAVGDHRRFVAALVVLDPDAADSWAREHGRPGATLAELAEDPDLQAEVDAGVRGAMSEFNNAEQVKKVRILPEEWQPDSEELTPTSKLKRRTIHTKYAEEIESLYE